MLRVLRATDAAPVRLRTVTLKAPCGHDGEPIIGTFVRCLKGCDDVKKSATTTEPSRPPITTNGFANTLNHTSPLDAAEQQWFDVEIASVRAAAQKEAFVSEGRAGVVVPRGSCPAGCTVFNYQRGGLAIPTLLNTLVTKYKYTVAEIRAAMLTRTPLDAHMARTAATTMVYSWAATVMKGFLERLPVRTTQAHKITQHTGMSSSWQGKSGVNIGDDVNEAVSRVAQLLMIAPGRRDVTVSLPTAQYNLIATRRYNGSVKSMTVMDHLLTQNPWIKQFRSEWRLQDRMVTAVLDPLWLECIVPVPFEQLPGKWEMTTDDLGLRVPTYVVTCHAERADDIALYHDGAVDYVEGIA